MGSDENQKAANLMYADVALVTEHHVISLFAVRGAAHVTDDVLVVFDAQAFHGFDGVLHVVVTLPLQGLHGSLHRQLVYRRLSWNTGGDHSQQKEGKSGSVTYH